MPAGARFCTRCGASLTGHPSRAAEGDQPPPAARPRGAIPVMWWITGASLVVLALVIAWPVLQPRTQDLTTGGTAPFEGATPTGGAPPNLSSMTPIEAADRLYQRVMMAVETGDEATVGQFLPMALQAYELARPLDADGTYHLATLQRAAFDFEGSLATALEGLTAAPDHLLLLAAAGEASEGLGDMDAARVYWQRFLDVYESERVRQLAEYEAHEFTLEESLTHAREVTGS